MKKIIAREGLFFLGFLVFGSLLYLFGSFCLTNRFDRVVYSEVISDPDYKSLPNNEQENLIAELKAPLTGFKFDMSYPKSYKEGVIPYAICSIRLIGTWLIFFGYIFYLVFVRFPIWAFKILRTK